MELFKSLNQISNHAKGAVVAVGNFDGVHRGHQALLKVAQQIAQDRNKVLAVLTFEPHPKRLFRPDDPPNRITTSDIKHERLETFGVKSVFCLNFDWDFASQSAKTFIQSILKNGIEASHVVVGKDFRFGQLRKGSPEDIARAGIPVKAVEKLYGDDEQMLSSSRIRSALRAGDLKTANNILGWEWEIRGEVIKGDQRGRELGYPTANIKLGDTIHPAYGIYAAKVQIEGEDIWRSSATNIGIRPMFEVPVAQVETFIFDFDEEIYGQTIHVKPVKRLRGEAKFETLQALIDQMAKDCEQARNILKP